MSTKTSSTEHLTRDIVIYTDLFELKEILAIQTLVCNNSKNTESKKKKKNEYFNGKDQSSLKEILVMFVSYESKKQNDKYFKIRFDNKYYLKNMYTILKFDNTLPRLYITHINL